MPQNARLVICGDGSERQALEAAARANNIVDQVVFTGYLDKPELALAGFDIFAMSSDTEQMPYGLLEAMSAGLPVAATDVGRHQDDRLRPEPPLHRQCRR